MKFRARMCAFLHIRQFAQMVHILARCSKQLVMRISSDKICFIVCERDSRVRNNNGPTAFCELPEHPYFEEYAMEGISPDANEIFLEIPSDGLAGVMNSSMKSVTNVSSLKIKLTRKNVPCLTMEIELKSATDTSQLCTHDIPVGLIKREDWEEYKDPDTPNFDVSFGMPELRILQRSLDRMRNMSQKVIISASKNGQLFFAVDKDSIKSTVKFKELLKVYDIGDDRGGSEDALTQAPNFAVEVDMKSLIQLIPQENMRPNSFICSILHERLLHFYLIYGEIQLQYFLPCSVL